MINTDKGEFTLNDSLILNPNIKKNDFRNLIKLSNLIIIERNSNNAYCWFDLKPIFHLKFEMAVSVCFYNEILWELNFTNINSKYGTTSNDWSKEKELKRKKAHDKWLRKLIGKPPYTYNWGSIYSIYDEKAGYSTIRIRFNRANPANKINKACSICNNNEVYYNDEYDAIYCAYCNKWLEKSCSSLHCEFCKDRPENPLY